MGEKGLTDFDGKTFASTVEAKEAVVAHTRLLGSVEYLIARVKNDRNAFVYMIF